ncbi:MAG: hypothetical protein IJ809_00680 [Clostridia bacterium]|nr:hypothetical protein [Clostridia bacterium]
MKKNIIIVILLIIIIGLVSSYLLNPQYSADSTSVLKAVIEGQVKISEYIGKLRADTFDAYTVEQLLLGVSNLDDMENSVISDTKGGEIIPLVNPTENVKKKGDVTYYKVNLSNFTKVLSTQLVNEGNLTWYISDAGVLKLSYSNKPKWWIDEFEVFHIN